MAENSGIAWTTHTHNEWEGCTKVGPGCDGCYAAARNDRFHGGANWGTGATRRLTSIQNRNRPFRWQRERRAAIDRGESPPPIRVFGGSLMDPFDNEVPQEWRASLWEKVRLTPDLEWIFVTKRVGNVAKMAPIGGFPRNVIILATIVDQDEANRDVPKLINLKDVGLIDKIGVSYEPALGPVDWTCIETFAWTGAEVLNALTGELFGILGDPLYKTVALDWLIVGGESDQGSHKARYFSIEWARAAILQTRGTGCAVFIKQLGGNPVSPLSAQAAQELHSFAGRNPDRPESMTLKDKAGANPIEWPADLRVREFPVIGGAR